MVKFVVPTAYSLPMLAGNARKLSLAALYSIFPEGIIIYLILTRADCSLEIKCTTKSTSTDKANFKILNAKLN